MHHFVILCIAENLFDYFAQLTIDNDKQNIETDAHVL